MPKFLVIRRVETSHSLIIEADDEYEAEALASDYDNDEIQGRWAEAEQIDTDETYTAEEEINEETGEGHQIMPMHGQPGEPTSGDLPPVLTTRVPFGSTPEPVEFPMAGDYRNDCPFCKTHNAILLKSFADGSYECRDCKRPFKCDNARKVWILA